MKNILFAILVLMYLPAFGQNNIKKTAAVTYTLGPPTYTVSLPSSSEIAVDTSTGKIYQYHRTTSTWLQLGQGIDVISGTIPPAYTPLRNMSKFAINGDNELYYYTGSSWVQINAGSGGTGGHVILEGNTPRAQRDSMEFQSNGSIVLAATNTSTRTVVEATIESNAVGSAEIAAGAVGTSEVTDNTITATDLAVNVVSSVDGVTNDGGDIDLIASGIVTITPNDAANTITIGATEVDGSTTNEVLTISDGTDSEALGGQTLNVTATGIATVDYIPATNTLTVGAVEVDGSTSNELQTISASGAGPTSYNVDLSNSGGSVTLAEGAGIDLTRSVNTITVANTGDLSNTNELQTLSVATNTTTLSNGGGSMTIAGAGINTVSTAGTTITVTGTEVDGSTSNELQTLSVATNTTTLSNGGGSMTIAGAGINTVSTAGSTITVTGTEIDGSITNEGLLGVGAGAINTSILTSNTSGANGVTIQVGGINTITETTSANGGTIVITATEVDGSASNELQTLSVATNTTTLSNGGGSMTIAGAGINTVSTAGTTITVTGTEVDGSTSNELQTISASGAGPTSYNVDLSNSGGSITLSEGAGVDLTRSVNNITISALDASASNELQTLSVATNTTTLSNGGGSMTIAGAGINTVSTTGTTITVTGTEVDGSTTNENLTISDGTDSENLGGQTLTVTGTGIAVADYIPATNTLTISAVEVDGSTSNELQTISASGAGPTSYNVDLSNSGGSVTLAEGAGIDLTRSVNTITVAALDASASNELQTLSVATNTTTLSNGGGSMTIAGAGINTVSTAGTTITVTGTEVDGSTSNELQTLSVATNTTTLSAGGGSMTIAGAGINTVSTAGSTITVTGTEIDGSITNEGLLGVGAGAANTSILTSNTSTANGVTIQVGGINTITETTSANGGTIVITATEVDGSASNELQTLSVATNTTTLSAGGGSMTIAGAGINTVSTAGSTITVTGTEVDGSTTNENLTISDGTDSENLGGQTLTVTATGIATVDYVPATNTLTVGAVEVDGSTSNEIQNLSYTASTGAVGISGGGTGTTIPVMVGATGVAAGERGLVPKPVAGDDVKFLRGDGTWATSTGADNWGSQVVQHGTTLTGSGTSGVPLDVATDGITANEIAADAVGSSEIAADAVGNSELAANAVDSTNVINYGLSVLDLGQHGASTGSVLKWNGTQWAPAADDDMPAVTANQIAYGNGSAITGHNRLTVDPTATATRLRLSGSGSGGGITIDSIGPGDKGLEMYSYSTTATEVPFLYAERSGANAAATMEMYANDAGAASDAVLKLRTQTGGAGDPMVQFTTDPGGSVGVWLIGVDNDDSDRLKIGRASSFSSGTDSYAITADNTTNNVYIGNGLLLPRDITTNISTSQNDYNPSGFTSASTYGFTSTGNVNITGITAGEDGRVLILTNRDATDNITLVNESASSTAANRFAIGSDITFGPGYSAVLRYDIASSRWRCIAKHTASTADNWGSQVVATDATLAGDGTSGNPLSWNGASTGGPISGNGFSGTPITVLNDAITAQYIAASAVTSSEIRDTTIVTQDIKDGAVTNAKLASGTGGMFKGSGTFASGAVGKLPSGDNIAYTYNNDNPAIYIDDASGDATVYSRDGSNSIGIGNGGILQQSNDGIAQYAPYTSITNGTTASELRFLEPSGSGTNYTGFKTSARADNRLYTMPTDTPADGDIWTWHTGDILSWDTPSAGGIYGNGTAGSGNGDIPNGGSTATVTGDDPLILNLDAAAGQTNRMLRLVTDYSAEDAITKMLQLVAPTDSLIVISQDQSIVFEYKGPAADGTSLSFTSNQDLTLDATTGTTIKGGGTELSVVGETILGTGAAAPLVNQVAHASGSITSTGDAQSSEVILRRTITGTSATELFLDGASVQAILPATNRIWTGTAKCSGSVTDVGNGATIVVGDTHARYQTFTVKRIGSSTTLMTAATGLTDTWTDTNMAGAAFTLTADNATEALKITFTPPTLAGSTTVCKAVCTVNVNELGF